MAVKHVDALVLRVRDLDRCVGFYRAIGLPLEREQHGDGPVHYACELGPVHVALYPADTPGEAGARLGGGATMVGFQVASVEDAYAAALGAGGTAVHEPDDYPWGRRALVADPDGRAVELNCAQTS